MKSKRSKCATAAKLALASALLVCVVALAAGCGGSDDSTDDGKVITVPAVDVVNSITEAIGDSGIDSTVKKGEADFDDNFKDLYGISADLITDGAFAYDSTGATADEITVLRVDKKDDIDKVQQALEERQSQRERDFNGYKPAESAKASDGMVFVCNHYVFLGICDDSHAARSAFMKFMQSAAQQDK